MFWFKIIHFPSFPLLSLSLSLSLSPVSSGKTGALRHLLARRFLPRQRPRRFRAGEQVPRYLAASAALPSTRTAPRCSSNRGQTDGFISSVGAIVYSVTAAGGIKLNPAWSSWLWCLPLHAVATIDTLGTRDYRIRQKCSSLESLSTISPSTFVILRNISSQGRRVSFLLVLLQITCSHITIVMANLVPTQDWVFLNWNDEYRRTWTRLWTHLFLQEESPLQSPSGVCQGWSEESMKQHVFKGNEKEEDPEGDIGLQVLWWIITWSDHWWATNWSGPRLRILDGKILSTPINQSSYCPLL